MLWFLVASWIPVVEHATYNSTSRDIGVYLQVLWNTGHGQAFSTTLLESNRIHLAEHLAPLLALLAPAYAIAPDPRWLLVLQQAALACSAIPVYLLARRLLGGVWLPTLVLAAFFAMPTLTEVALDAFYPVTFAALPISYAGYFLITGRWRRGVACALLAPLIEEEAALTVIGLGFFMLLERAGRRWSLPLLAFGGLWLALAALVVMPSMHDPTTLRGASDNRTAAHFDALRQDFAAALGTVGEERALPAARWLLAPSGGLALLAPEVLLIDLPHAATLLLGDKEGRYRRHWAAPLLPTIWLATVIGLARLRQPTLRTAGIALLCVGSATTYLADSSLPGGGEHEPADVVWSDRAEQLSSLVGAIPPDASVAASRRVLGHLADRSELYVYPPSYAGKLWPPERRVQTYLFDLTNDQTREALAGRQSPFRATRPYAIWVAGPDALLLTDRPPPATRMVEHDVGGMRLLGYDVRQDGLVLDVAIHWQLADGGTRPQGRVVQLVGDSGEILARAEGGILDGLFPVSEWSVGQVLVERSRLVSAGGIPTWLDVGWVDQGGNLTLTQLPIASGAAR